MKPKLMADNEGIQSDSVFEYLDADFAGNGEEVVRHGSRAL